MSGEVRVEYLRFLTELSRCSESTYKAGKEWGEEEKEAQEELESDTNGSSIKGSNQASSDPEPSELCNRSRFVTEDAWDEGVRGEWVDGSIESCWWLATAGGEVMDDKVRSATRANSGWFEKEISGEAAWYEELFTSYDTVKLRAELIEL